MKKVIKNIVHRITSENFRKSCFALLLKFKYWCTICRLRKVYGERKIVVAFCVSELAKWKSQSLYDRLAQTDTYSPVIYVYPSPLELNCKDSHIQSLLEAKSNFFRDKGMEVVNIWNATTKQCIIPKVSRPDIVFYQQPWDMPPFPYPSDVADFALTFYIPYYLVNNFDLELETGHLLHHQVFGYIVQNMEHAKLYDLSLNRKHYAGKRLGLGHTIVDNLTLQVSYSENDYIIYAPHFSIPVSGEKHPLTYSTFLENGKLILEFAKQHPEFKWVFKPHPILEAKLKNTAVWSEEEVDEYYSEWKRIGTVCETSDYIEHFQKSSVMITDCGSFLTEYSCMDKPLIRLYYYVDNLPPNPMLEKLYKTFYYAHNNFELMELMERIICQHQDPHKITRHEEVVRLGLGRSDASKKIINYLDSLLS